MQGIQDCWPIREKFEKGPLLVFEYGALGQGLGGLSKSHRELDAESFEHRCAVGDRRHNDVGSRAWPAGPSWSCGRPAATHACSQSARVAAAQPPRTARPDPQPVRET